MTILAVVFPIQRRIRLDPRVYGSRLSFHMIATAQRSGSRALPFQQLMPGLQEMELVDLVAV